MESVTIARPEVRWREGAAARAGWPQVGSYWHARGSRTLAPSPKVPAPMPIRSFRPVLTVLSTLAHVVGCAAMLLACGGSGSSSGSSADSGAPGVELTVPTLEGPVQADVVGGVRRFLKIPYAKPPVGPLRWKAPVKSDPWTAVRHETTFASPCPQSASAQAPQSTDEDCLYLNVWTPERTPANAPVMVWFHGGGNFSGSAADTVPTTKQLWYDGQFFASRHGVVVVTTNYRLGPFGFFAHPALAAEGSPSGNQGMLDQRRVLQWVQENIAAFGGDKTNVTIFGESAGSSDVCYHVASPGDSGLFQRAISESGGCTVSINGGPDPTVAQVAPQMLAFTKALGCDTAADPLACLRGQSAANIVANAMQPDPTSGQVTTATWSFALVVDGAGGFMPEQARTLYDTGKVAHVPYLLGSNNDEGTLFLLGSTPVATEPDYAAALQQRFGAAATQIEALYPPSNFGGDYNAALARVIGDSSLVCGTHDTARRAAKAGLPVFMHNFDIPWGIDPTGLMASHASEISHVFGDPVAASASSKAVSDAMNAFWAQFALTGTPNGAGAPATWPDFAPDANDNDQRLQLDPGWEVVDDFRKAECTFWRAQYDAAFASP
jgi:para-nitrobenzyl esterase